MKYIIIKRLNKKGNKWHVILNEYSPSFKYVLFINSKYHKTSWHTDYKVFKTKKGALSWVDNNQYRFNW